VGDRADVVIVERGDDGVATLTMSRPQARNALNGELLGALRTAMADLDTDERVAVVIVTGADPAFCAGLDLKELGPGRDASGPRPAPDPGNAGGGPWAPMRTPVIGAVNGPAVTGGFEIALQCDFLVASERARFADTHARVGLLPGWGLSVLLPQAVGVRKARELSFTGAFLDAEDALRLGLVNHVVAHADLLPTARAIAAEIAGNDRRAVQALLAEYRDVTATTVAEGLRIESERAAAWNSDPGALADVARRRAAITERGSRFAR
jgi:enoyl-CoA hydratase